MVGNMKRNINRSIEDNLKDIFDLSKIDNVYKEIRDKDSPLSRMEIDDKLPLVGLATELNNKLKIRAFVISKTTVLIPLDDILPECGHLTKGTRTPRVVCIADPGQCSQVPDNCISKLLGRLGKIASAQDGWKLYYLYWRLYVDKDKNKDRRFGLKIWAETSNMEISPINEYILDYFINRRSKEFEIEMEL